MMLAVEEVVVMKGQMTIQIAIMDHLETVITAVTKKLMMMIATNHLAGTVYASLFRSIQTLPTVPSILKQCGYKYMQTVD